MANSYDVINLSELDVPDTIVVPDATENLHPVAGAPAELDKQFDALVESDPTFKQGR